MAPLRVPAALLAAILLIGGCPRPTGPAPAPAAAGPVTLTILSTNDLHGQLDPLELRTTEQPPRRFRVGGAAALAATISRLRARNPRGTLLFDAGDFMQGSLLSNTFEGAPVRELFEVLGYDAVVIGNHEFDFGPVGDGRGKPTGALQAWAAAAHFPVLTANILRRATGRPVGWANVRPSVMLTRAGINIGVVGVTTPATSVTTMPAHVAGLRFAPLLGAVRREAGKLRAAGAMVVLVLAHAGGSCADRDPKSCRGELFSRLLAGLRPGEVDAVVAGHSHRCIWHRFNGVPVVEACSRGIAVARLELAVDRQAGKVVRSTLFPPALTCHDVFSDTRDCEGRLRSGAGSAKLVPAAALTRFSREVRRARSVVQRHRSRLGAKHSRVLARVARPLTIDPGGSSSLGTLFADALLAAVPGADAAIVNSGSLRADIPAGPVTLDRLFSVFPFDNRLATAELDGNQLRRLVTLLLQNGHGLLQVANLRLEVACDGKRRLLSLSDGDGAPLAPDRRYRVVLSDFLLTGGDGLGPVLSAVPASRKTILPRMVRDEVARYLQAQEQPVNTPERPAMARPAISVIRGVCGRARLARRPLCR